MGSIGDLGYTTRHNNHLSGTTIRCCFSAVAILLLQLFGDGNAWARLNTWEARDGWDASLGRCQSASPLTRQCLCHSCRCPDTWTLVARVSVSRIVGHWAVLSTHWIVSETPVSTFRFGHLGSSCSPASCHSHFPCSFKSAHCPLLLGVPRDHLCWDTLGPPARLPWDTPCPASTCACSQSLPFENTCATVCQSPGGHLAIEHKRVPRVLPRSTLLGPTWTPDTCPHTQ